MNRTDVLVIGGGLAGLTAAYQAKKKGLSVRLLEKSNRTGGVIRSEHKNGYLLEHGPNTVLLNAELLELIRSLGLEDRMMIADPQTPRYILHRNKFYPVPLSPLGFAKSRLVSPLAKVRVLMEPWAQNRPDTPDESLDSFVRRRLGAEVAERLVAPFVSGIWAGHPAQLSAAGCFPKLAEMETAHGSLLWAGLKSRKSKKTDVPKGMVSFPDGLETLVQELKKSLAADIQTQVNIRAIHSDQGWRVRTENNEWDAARLIIATPALEAADLIASLDPTAAHTLQGIPYAPLAVVHIGFRKSDIRSKLRGFGFLCDPADSSPILGAVFNTHMFKDRAPDGIELLTVFMGGTRRPDLLAEPDENLIEKAQNELTQRLKIKGKRTFSSVTRHARAVPQYALGHQQRMDIIEAFENRHSGIKLIGNIRGGISVGDVVKTATSGI